MADVDLDQLAHELYALPPDQFVDARAAVVAVARDAGQTSTATTLGKLRKPTVTAFLANQLVRTAPDVVAGVIAIGPAMREATVEGDAAALRDLGRHRAALLSDLVGRARTIGEENGLRVTATHQRELEATFTAAAADDQAAALLRTGRITGPLESAGMGFDLGGVPPARPGAGSERAPASGDARPSAAGERAAEAAREQAAQTQRERAVVEAEQALADARLQDADAEAALADAQETFDEAMAAEAAAAEALRVAKAAVSDARADLTAAKADATATGRAVAAALAAVERATRR